MDCYLGQIFLFAFDYAPDGFALCDGARISIQENQALYSLITTTYGGDGRTYFQLPNLLGAEPVPHLRYYIATNGNYPPRS